MHHLDGMRTSVSANSERRERVGINASFENASKNNDTLGASNVTDETRHNNPDEVSELSVPETHFDRQAHTHHMVTVVSIPVCHTGDRVSIPRQRTISPDLTFVDQLGGTNY